MGNKNELNPSRKVMDSKIPGVLVVAFVSIATHDLTAALISVGIVGGVESAAEYIRLKKEKNNL